MSAPNRKVRRYLLRPLVRRPQRVADRKAFIDALGRLDNRALGETVLAQLRDVLSFSRSDKAQGYWKDPVFARKAVALFTALYVSRRMTKHEYFYWAAYFVEAVLEKRWTDGKYKNEVKPISQAMDDIERQHGLQPDEFWPLGTGPEEYIRLNSQYEALYDAKFLETLREFGLDNLADLKEQTPQEFERLCERGRRSVAHRDELALAIRDVVLLYEEDARRAASVKAYTAAVTALGAGVEGLLLLRCLRSSQKASRIAKNKLPKRLRPRSPDDHTTWTFETLIEVCLKAGWLPPVDTSVARYNPAGLAHLLRRMRNYVHPGRRARERPWLETDEREYQDANAIYVVLLSILGKIRSSKANNSA